MHHILVKPINIKILENHYRVINKKVIHIILEIHQIISLKWIIHIESKLIVVKVASKIISKWGDLTQHIYHMQAQVLVWQGDMLSAIIDSLFFICQFIIKWLTKICTIIKIYEPKIFIHINQYLLRRRESFHNPLITSPVNV